MGTRGVKEAGEVVAGHPLVVVSKGHREEAGEVVHRQVVNKGRQEEGMAVILPALVT